MKLNRRTWLRVVGSLGVAVGVAGCSSGALDGDGDTQETDSRETATTTTESQPETQTTTETTETTTEEATAPADFGESVGSQEKGPNPAATDETGTVATDKLTSGLTFTDHYHYSMNGVEGVAGTVENESETTFETVTIHVTVDPGGAGPYTKTLKSSLPAGETQRFQFRFGDDAPEEVDSYTIWATGEQ
ncbi:MULTISPECIES: hypothetical protein [Haloferax]|uniref:Uncharacterized protein n=2 Tax=Haloferax TaxID=2251 RepID=A0A6G1Z119_9EURY|nr:MULTISPECIES: hypothetical protein [Haloferax]KAB1187337.1 hypothetical protein Hfx1149_04570 [Haloferax sp. CBA1149]MRW79984.1 hypothetical protein [Haloferax marinisediminis]